MNYERAYFELLQARRADAQNLLLRPQAAAPADPADGLVALPDGSGWNPGNGWGPHVYNNGLGLWLPFWGPWNDGAGSGLDADLLDGLHAAQIDADKVDGYHAKIVHISHYQTGAVASGTGAIPDDDTIPQNTEGDQYMSIAHTPLSASNKLFVEAVAHGTSTVAGYGIAALFKDSDASALAAIRTGEYYSFRPIVVCHEMVAGTVSAITFKLRIAGPGPNFTFNGTTGTRRLGGVMASFMRVTEYTP